MPVPSLTALTACHPTDYRKEIRTSSILWRRRFGLVYENGKLHSRVSDICAKHDRGEARRELVVYVVLLLRQSRARVWFLV